MTDTPGTCPHCGTRLKKWLVPEEATWSDEFFFVCADHSAATERVDGYFIDDRAKEWTSVLKARDPIFLEHRAMLIRARADPEAVGPVLGWIQLTVLSAFLALAGWLRLRSG